MLGNRNKIKAQKLVERLKVIGLVVILSVIMPGTSVAGIGNSGDNATSEPTFFVNGEEVSEAEYNQQKENCAGDCQIEITEEIRQGEEGESMGFGSDGMNAIYNKHSLTTPNASEDEDPSPVPVAKAPNNYQNTVPSGAAGQLNEQNIDTIAVAATGAVVPEIPFTFSLEANCIG